MAQEDVFKKLVSHCKEYGFVFPSSDIYDGLGAVYDYGQMGVELNFMNKNHSIWAETKISDLNRTTFLERWSLLWQKNTLGLELLRSLQVQELPHI